MQFVELYKTFTKKLLPLPVVRINGQKTIKPAFKIRQYMDNSNPEVTPNLYNLLYKVKAQDCMVESEAYAEAFSTAEELTAQYVSAVLLAEECQRAAEAVCCFTDADAAQLDGDDVAQKFYQDVSNDKNYKAVIYQYSGVGSAEIQAAAAGVESFRTHEKNGVLIFKGAASKNVSFLHSLHGL